MPDGFFADQNAQTMPLVETPDDLPLHSSIEIVHPRGRARKVRAVLADQDGEIVTPSENRLPYHRGADYIVDDELGTRAIVRKDIFEKSYRRIGRGLFKTRHGLRLRAVVADRDLNIATLDGEQVAHRTDWIMIGVADEMWPLPAEVARAKYKPASAIGWTGVGVTILAAFVLVMFALVKSLTS